MAEVAVPRTLFAEILRLIAELRSDPTASAGAATWPWAVPGDHGAMAWHKLGQA